MQRKSCCGNRLSELRKFNSIYSKEAGSKMLAFLCCFQGKYPRNEIEYCKFQNAIEFIRLK